LRSSCRLLLSLAAAGCGGPQSYDLDGGDLVTVGKRFVDQRGCPMCHQSSSAADGVLSGQTTPRPGTLAYGANLTPDHETGIGDWADIAIVRAMRYGFDDEGEPLCPPMPRCDGTDATQSLLTDLEASAIVAYLRSLPPVSRAIPESRCPPLKPPPSDGGAGG
jgi:Cytochrome c